MAEDNIMTKEMRQKLDEITNETKKIYNEVYKLGIDINMEADAAKRRELQQAIVNKETDRMLLVQEALDITRHLPPSAYPGPLPAHLNTTLVTETRNKHPAVDQAKIDILKTQQAELLDTSNQIFNEIRDLKKKIEKEADPVRKDEFLGLVTAREAIYTELRQRIANTTMLLNVPVPPPDASRAAREAFLVHIRETFRTRSTPPAVVHDITDAVPNNNNNNAARNRDRDNPNITTVGEERRGPSMIASFGPALPGHASRKVPLGIVNDPYVGRCVCFGMKCEACSVSTYFYYLASGAQTHEIDIDAGKIKCSVDMLIDKAHLVCTNQKCRNNLEKHKLIDKNTSV
jgi:hypothetical protein